MSRRRRTAYEMGLQHGGIGGVCTPERARSLLEDLYHERNLSDYYLAEFCRGTWDRSTYRVIQVETGPGDWTWWHRQIEVDKPQAPFICSLKSHAIIRSGGYKGRHYGSLGYGATEEAATLHAISNAKCIVAGQPCPESNWRSTIDPAYYEQRRGAVFTMPAEAPGVRQFCSRKEVHLDRINRLFTRPAALRGSDLR